MNINLFFDMDGVLAEYDPLTAEKMYDKNFFRDRPPMEENIKLIKKFLKNKEYNVYILSTVLADSNYAVDEKNEWLDKYIPELKKENRLFVKSTETKTQYVNEQVPNIEDSLNVLFDDYSVNLWNWLHDGFVAIKILNGINNSKGTWLTSNPHLVLNENDHFKYSNTNKLLEKVKKAE